MKKNQLIKLAVAVLTAATTLTSVNASAAIVITEANPTGSNATYAADWFELTNTGASTVNISGWKIDDNSNSFSAAVALNGVTSLAAGQSVVFIEGGATEITNFKSVWFGNNVPGDFTIGSYSGSGVGLSASSDAINIFNSSGNLVTRVDFGTATVGKTFDNVAGIGSSVLPSPLTSQNAVISQLSTVGVNGAFSSANGNEIGSPGVAPVPEPESYALLLAGLGLLGFVARRRKKM